MAQNTQDHIEPLNVDTQRELEQVFQDMSPFFEGKESEQNWNPREQSILKLRRITKGNAPKDFPSSYAAGIKLLLDGIVKTVNSLRTTVSTNGCRLVSDIAKTIGPGLDPMFEILMREFIKLCAGTKKISAQNGYLTVQSMLESVSYSVRQMQHLWNACQDKNVQPRTFATTWLKTVINKNVNSKSQFEHTGGLDLCEKCIKKGLGDANPGVREGMRSTFWLFEKFWPEAAAGIMSTLDSKQKGLLENHAENPHSKGIEQKRADSASSSRTATIPRVKPDVPARPSVRDAIIAARSGTKQTGSLSSAPLRPSRKIATSVRSASSKDDAKQSMTKNPQTVNKPVFVASGRPSRSSSLSSSSAGDAKQSITKSAKTIDKPTSVASGIRSRSSSLTGSSKGDAKQSVTKNPQAVSKPVFVASGRPSRSSSLTGSSKGDTKQSITKGPKTMDKPVLVANGKSSQSSSLSGTSKGDAKQGITKGPKTTDKPVLVANGKSSRSSSLSVSSKGDAKQGITKKPQIINKPEQTTKKAVSTSASITYNSKAGSNKSVSVSDGKISGYSSVAISPLSLMNWSNWSVKDDSTDSEVDPELQDVRHFLATGISRILSNTIDMQYIKMLQALFDTDLDVWQDGVKFEELLLALFDYLERPILAPKPVSVNATDLNIQALATVRLMLKSNQKYFQTLVPRGLCCLISARRNYDQYSYMGSGLEELADELIAYGKAEDCVTVVLDLLQVEKMGHESTKMGPESTKMAFDVLGCLIHHLQPGCNVRRVGSVVVKFLGAASSVVRNAAVECCVDLHNYIGTTEKFWEVMAGASEHRRMMITYCVEKRTRQFSEY